MLAAVAMPPVPLSVEGASVLHQMMRFRRPEWRALSTVARNEILLEASTALAALEHSADGRQSALFSLLGHKGDILFVHFRRTFEELDHAQRDLARLAIGDFLEPTSSYLSIVELGIYESTAKVYGALIEKGIQPYSDQWKQEIEATLDRHRQAMAPRLWAAGLTCSRESARDWWGGPRAPCKMLVCHAVVSAVWTRYRVAFPGCAVARYNSVLAPPACPGLEPRRQ